MKHFITNYCSIFMLFLIKFAILSFYIYAFFIPPMIVFEVKKILLIKRQSTWCTYHMLYVWMCQLCVVRSCWGLAQVLWSKRSTKGPSAKRNWVSSVRSYDKGFRVIRNKKQSSKIRPQTVLFLIFSTPNTNQYDNDRKNVFSGYSYLITFN